MTTLHSKQSLIGFVKKMAMMMVDPERLKQTILNQKNSSSYQGAVWGDLSIAEGYPGVVLLLIELDRLFPNEGWDNAVHTYILKIKQAVEATSITDFSLFGGLAGVCLSLAQASRGEKRYEKMLRTLETFLLQQIDERYFFPLAENLKKGEPSAMMLYDLIQGITGIGAYAFVRNDHSLIEKISTLLIALTHPIRFEGRMIPGWYVPSKHLVLEEDRISYPKGNFNLGQAHGISGVLAFLSIALLRGFELEGQKEAIETISRWLMKQRKEIDQLFFWNLLLPFEEERNPKKEVRFFGRDAWCYGTPGVARSLFLAGESLSRPDWQEFALESFRSVFKRTRKEWGLIDPTFCHGISGLLMITWHMAQDTDDSDLKGKAADLKKMILDFYVDEHPLGFKSKVLGAQGGYIDIDQSGLLEGVSGILLTLLSLEKQTSWWDAPFLIQSHKKTHLN